MGRGPFVRLANKAMPVMENVINCGDTHHSQSCERHCEGKKGAGAFQDVAKGIGIRIHFASNSWKDTLTQCRPDDVHRGTKAALAGLKKRLKLRAVAIRPPAAASCRDFLAKERSRITMFQISSGFVRPPSGGIWPLPFLMM